MVSVDKCDKCFGCFQEMYKKSTKCSGRAIITEHCQPMTPRGRVNKQVKLEHTDHMLQTNVKKVDNCANAKTASNSLFV